MQYNLEELIDGARDRMKPFTAFWIFAGLQSLLAVAEPLLIGVEPYGRGQMLQISVLAISTVLYLVLLFVTFTFVKKSVPTFVKLRCLFDNEVIFETVCIAIGWIFIIPNPGIAALRCFRVFKIGRAHV